MSMNAKHFLLHSICVCGGKRAYHHGPPPPGEPTEPAHPGSSPGPPELRSVPQRSRPHRRQCCCSGDRSGRPFHLWRPRACLAGEGQRRGRGRSRRWRGSAPALWSRPPPRPGPTGTARGGVNPPDAPFAWRPAGPAPRRLDPAAPPSRRPALARTVCMLGMWECAVLLCTLSRSSIGFVAGIAGIFATSPCSWEVKRCAAPCTALILSACAEMSASTKVCFCRRSSTSCRCLPLSWDCRRPWGKTEHSV